MNLDREQLTQLFAEIDSVLVRSGNRELRVMHPFVFEHSQEGGMHRIRLMDALSAAVNGVDTVTADEDRHSKPWYSDTDQFIEVAAMAVAQFNRN
jgi:hypothetical protein